MMILSGCASTAAKIVKVEDFCNGRYEPSGKFTKKDFQNLDEIRKNTDYQVTIDKFIKPVTINEKEYEHCTAND